MAGLAHQNSWVPCCGPAVPVEACSVAATDVVVTDSLNNTSLFRAWSAANAEATVAVTDSINNSVLYYLLATDVCPGQTVAVNDALNNTIIGYGMVV